MAVKRFDGKRRRSYNGPMTTKEITAKFKGRCIGCPNPVLPGQAILFHGKGRSEHVECGLYNDDLDGVPFDRGYGNPVRVHVTRFNSGATQIRNTRGRCEDAPCCGCCT